jgi:hypothetical protein
MTEWTTPPKLALLITALKRLDGDPGIVEAQAQIIDGRMLAVMTQTIARGHDIGGDNADGFYANPRTATAGLARELRDLGGKARKAVAGKVGMKGWMNAWAALPDRTMRLLWRPLLNNTAEGRIDRSTLAGSFSAPGFSIVAPKPELLLMAIEAQLVRIRTTPGARRRQRMRNEYEHAAIEAIRNAYRAITGKQGGRVINEGRLDGRFFRLGREIDSIFGTQLFPVKDSRRLRRSR